MWKDVRLSDVDLYEPPLSQWKTMQETRQYLTIYEYNMTQKAKLYGVISAYLTAILCLVIILFIYRKVVS